MSVQIASSPVSNVNSMSPTSTSTSSSKHSRHSLIMMANNLKPSRQKIQQYFTKSRRSVAEPASGEWKKAYDLGSVMKMTSLQLGGLGNPGAPVSPVAQESRNNISIVRDNTEKQLKDSRNRVSIVRVGSEQQLKQEPGLTPTLETVDPVDAKRQPWHEPVVAPAAEIVDAEQLGREQPYGAPEFDSFLTDSSLVYRSKAPQRPASKYRIHTPPSSIALTMSSAPSVEDTASSLQQPMSSSSPRPIVARPPVPVPNVMSMETDPTEPRVRRGPSLIRPRPRSVMRRREKMPVNKTGGHWDIVVAKRRQEAAIKRQCSIRSMARQYRTLIDDTLIDVDDVPPVPPVPLTLRIPSIHEEAPPTAPASRRQDFDEDYGPIPRHFVAESPGAGLLESPRSRLAPSPVQPDTHTLVPLPEDVSHSTPLLFPSTTYRPSSRGGGRKGEDEKNGGMVLLEDCRSANDDISGATATNALPFQIGFKVLTRELSMAFADDSTRAASDTAGLQVKVMIAAYEQLRDQMSAQERRDPRLKGAKAIFDTWLDALRAVQKSISEEGAESDSEYDDE